ncbi:MAG: sigma-70 family RNA polymerase sigma factor [Anaerorhabdus sp.]|uniref:RNA polymerase sigma factor n=1 Tax=Anaerorhabdus sp. TaxID=1872524 RepID=UPI002FC66806
MENREVYESLALLLEEAKKGSIKAFEEIYEKTKTRQYFLALKYVHDESLAQDVVQETFIKLYHYLDKIENSMSLLSYLKKINYSVSMRELKKQGTQPKQSIDSISESEFIQKEWDKDDKNEKIKNALSNMTERNQEIIKLKYIDRYKIKEIAKLKKVSEKTISRRIQDAKEEFKNIYLTL